MEVEIKEENVHLIMFPSNKGKPGYEVPNSFYEHAIQSIFHQLLILTAVSYKS